MYGWLVCIYSYSIIFFMLPNIMHDILYTTYLREEIYIHIDILHKVLFIYLSFFLNIFYRYRHKWAWRLHFKYQ